MSARLRMTMRCATTRQTPTGPSDDYGQEITAKTAVLSDQPCYWQVQSDRFLADGNKVMASGLHTLWLPRGTDITEQDMVINVNDRRGRALLAFRLRVVAAVNRETHVEVSAEAYT